MSLLVQPIESTFEKAIRPRPRTQRIRNTVIVSTSEIVKPSPLLAQFAADKLLLLSHHTQQHQAPRGLP